VPDEVEYLPDLPTVVTPSQAAHEEKSDAWLRDDIDSPPLAGPFTEAGITAENAPTQEVPASVFRSYFDQAEAPSYDAAHQVAEDDLEDLPTAKVEAATTGERGHATPPLGSKTIPPSQGGLPAASPPEQESTLPITNSLDQLWAPIRHHSSRQALSGTASSPGETPFLVAHGMRAREEPNEEAMLDLDQEEVEDSDDSASDAPGDLSDLFAPWHATPDWQPPILPRYGPPITSAGEDETEEQRQSPGFSEDDFLR
jgi:hypothetical protein